METKKKYLIVLTGPTAVGKTDLSIKVATYFNTEIVSADARQFYREMAIGTAKPDVVQLSKVKHHFINNLSVTEEYTVSQFETEALTLLDSLFKLHDVVVLTGGSGLFINVLLEGMDEIPDVEPQHREELNLVFGNEGLVPLLEELQHLDPVYYELVDKANPVRIIRALEVCRSTGVPFSSFRKSEKKIRPFDVVKVVLDRPREELYARINQRMEGMLKEGLVEEVMALNGYRQLNALQTVGYKEVFGYLDQSYDYDEMIRLLKRNSRRYAKRQLTWFAKDKAYKWFHPNQEDEIFDFIIASVS